MIDYYEVLQVSPTASPEVISAAYRRLAQMHHPDAGGSAEKMKLLNQAYENLSNPVKRQMYDDWREQAATTIHTEEPSRVDTVPEVSQIRPWVRFWARTLDMYIYGIALGVLIGILAPYEDISDIEFYILFALTWPFLEALFISRLGYTPAKLALSTKVSKIDGGLLSYKEALLRSFWAFSEGAGAGIPLINLVTLSISYNYLKSTGATKWDTYYCCSVTHQRIGLIRATLVVILFIGILVLLEYANTL
jgi:uncharacterized RDD family membrane protein YckC